MLSTSIPDVVLPGELDDPHRKATRPLQANTSIVTDGMDASTYTGPAAGSFRRESSLEPDGIKVPKWKFTHAKDKEDSLS